MKYNFCISFWSDEDSAKDEVYFYGLDFPETKHAFQLLRVAENLFRELYKSGERTWEMFGLYEDREGQDSHQG